MIGWPVDSTNYDPHNRRSNTGSDVFRENQPGKVKNNVPVETLTSVRDRMLPMMELAAQEYAHRMPAGYPKIVDEPERGAFGLILDPSHALHIVSDGTNLYAEMTARSSRTDARASAGREKYSGMPFNDRRQITETISDQELRNLIGELLSRYNMLPRVIHITDT